MNELPPSLRRSCREGQRHFHTHPGLSRRCRSTAPCSMVRRLFYAPTAHETSRRCDPASDRRRRSWSPMMTSWSMTARTCACVANLRWSRMPNLIVRPFKAMHCDSQLATVERRLSTRSALHTDFTCTRARPATAGNYPSPMVAAGTSRPTSGRQVEAPFAPRQSVQ